MKRLTSVAIGIAALAMNASAAAYTLTPAEGWPGTQLDGVTLAFDSPVTDVQDVTQVSGLLSVTYQSSSPSSSTNVSKGMTLVAEGNNLKLSFTRNSGVVKVGSTKPFSSMGTGSQTVMEGDMTFNIAAGTFNVGGEPNEAISFTYFMSLEEPVHETDFSFTSSLAEGWQASIGKDITLTFNSEVVAVDNTLSIYCNTVNGYGVYDTEYTSNISKKAEGNVLTLSVGKAASKENTSGTFKVTSPKLLAGEYIVTVPAGTYTVGGEPGPEITLSYYLSNTEPVFNFTPTFTPEAGSTVSEVGTIVADFGAGANVAWASDAANNISLYKVGGAVQNCNVHYTLSASGSQLTLVPDVTMTDVATYELTIGAGAMTNNGKANTEAITVQYVIDTPPLPEPQDFPFTVTPITDSYYQELKAVALTFDTNETIEMLNKDKGNCYVTFEGMNPDMDGSNPSQCYWFANDKFTQDNCTRVEGNTAYFVSTAGVKQGQATNYDSNGAFAGGYVNVVIREATLLIGGIPNNEITLRYYVADNEPDFMMYDLTPETTDEISELTSVKLDYWAATNVAAKAETLVGELKFNGEATDAAVVTGAINGTEVEFTLTPAQTAYGVYTITIPAGQYTVDGLDNNETVLIYTIEKPKVYNFVPTFTPAPETYIPELGTITADFGTEAEVSWADNADVTFTEEGSETAVEGAYTLSAEGTVLTITRENAITENGTYVLTIKAGAMINNGMANPEDIIAKFFVGEPAPNTDFIPEAPSDVFCYIHQCSDRKDESGTEYVKVEDYGYISFVLNSGYTANGKDREYSASALSYRILIDNIDTPYIFEYIPAVKDENGEEISPARFPMLQGEDPMEWVAGNYSNWEFPVSQTDKLHRCFLYGVNLENVERVGVQSRGLFSGQFYTGEVVWVTPEQDPRETSGIDFLTFDGNETVEYYDMQGCKVDATTRGILIKRTTGADGNVKVTKVIR